MTLTTWTFTYTGSLDTFVVPFHTPGTLTIAVYGAQGGSIPGQNAGAQGGSVTGYCTLSPGTTLTLAVGQQGQVGVGTGTPAPGGWSPTAHPAGWKKV